MSEKRNSFDYLFNVDLKRYVKILSEQKSFVIIFCLSSILCSLGLTYVISEKYVSSTTIFYRPVETSLLRQKETVTFGAPAPSAPFKVIIQTLQNVLKSEVVLRPVVKKVRLDVELPFYEHIWYKRWLKNSKDFVKKNITDLWTLCKYGRIINEDPTTEAMKRLYKNTDITATKDSYIYTLRVKDKYPARVALLVDEIGATLVDWLKEQDRSPAHNKSIQLQEQLRIKEAEIEDMLKQRKKILEDNDIFSISEETVKAIENLYLMELDDIRIRSRIEKRNKEMEIYSKEVNKQSNSIIQPEDFKAMVSEKFFGAIDLEGLRAEQAHLNTSINELKEQLKDFPQIENELDALNMKITAAKREYQHIADLYTESFEQAEMVQSEIHVLHSAIVPTKPVQPIKIYHVGLSALLSLFISTGLIYIFAFFNVRVFFKSQGIKGRQANSQIK